MAAAAGRRPSPAYLAASVTGRAPDSEPPKCIRSCARELISAGSQMCVQLQGRHHNQWAVGNHTCSLGPAWLSRLLLLADGCLRNLTCSLQVATASPRSWKHLLCFRSR